jgi:DNA repair exonuclease SbcCD nuclease subunit
MKILLSADWHLRLGSKNIPIPWAVDRYFKMFKEIHSLESRADIQVISGDIMDRLPNMEELELYFEFIKDCTIPTYILPGNHEALKKDSTFLSYLKKVTNTINNKVIIIDEICTIEGIDFLPYNCLKQFEKGVDFNFQGDILCSHFRAEIPPHVKAEIDLNLFNRWKIVLLGDLHSHENSQRNLLYPGSPVTTSFHRTLVDTGVILYDTSNYSYDWIKLNVPQLIRKTVKAGEPMLATDYHHTIFEVEGDMSELGAIEDSELVDKKLLKRTTDTALILDPSLTIQEEVKEYLLYILQLGDDTVDKVLGILNNNLHKIE